jgi:hypothetical protein
MSVVFAPRDLSCLSAAARDVGAFCGPVIDGNLPHYEFSGSNALATGCIELRDQTVGLTSLASGSARFKEVLIPRKDRSGNQTGVRVQWYDREKRRFCKAPTEEQFIQSLAVPTIAASMTSSIVPDDLTAASLPRISTISPHLTASCVGRFPVSEAKESSPLSSMSRPPAEQVVEWKRRPESIPSIATPPSLVRSVERLGEALFGRSTTRCTTLFLGWRYPRATYGRSFFGGRIHLAEPAVNAVTHSDCAMGSRAAPEGLVPQLLSCAFNPLITLARAVGANSRSLFDRIAGKSLRRAVYTELFNSAAFSKRCFGEPVLGVKFE